MLTRHIGKLVLFLAADIILCLGVQGQSTYHFHTESAGTGYYLLSTAGPDAAATTLTTGNLKSITGNVWIGNWASAAGVPNTVGAVLANSTFQFSLWMGKSANYGTIYPVVQVGKLDSNQNVTSWATAVATTPLTTTLTKVTFSLTVPSAQSLAATDRWWVEVGVNIPSSGSTTHSVTASFAFEGSLSGNYDSTATLPAILVSISISPPNPAVPLGLVTQLSATGNFSDSSTQDVSKLATWSSSQPTVATVSSTGVVTSQTQGTTTITATASSVSGSATLNVSAPELLNVIITPTQALLPPGTNQQMTATASYSNGASQDVTSATSWSSSPSSVATINSTGMVTAVGTGTATISATINGLTFLSNITVTSSGPPVITASVSPSPNAAGWNNSSVTVTFTCKPGSAPIVNCPAPQVVSSEGANQVVSGTVTDSSGNTASTSVTVNIDETPPALVLSAPADGSTVSTSPLTATGTVTDALSGISSLTCNGTPVAVSNSFSCDISLNPGINLVAVRATDIAGNVALASLHVTYPVYPVPTSLTITPTGVSLTVGQTQQFTAIDDHGYPRPDATWTLPKRTTVATITTGASPVLTAAAVGQVVLTATVQGISTQTTVNVVSSVPGSSWSVPPLSGFSGGSTSVGHFAPAVPSDTGVGLYSVESGPSTAVRALTADGQQLWQKLLSYTQVIAPDLVGGVLVNIPSTGTLADLDAKTGSTLWSTGATGVGNVALRTDGSFVGIIGNRQNGPLQVVVVNGATGQTIEVPISDVSTSVITTISCSGSSVTTSQSAPNISSVITADSDGNAYFEYVVSDSNETVVFAVSGTSCNEVADYRKSNYRLVLVAVSPNGSTSTAVLVNRTYTVAVDGQVQSGSGSFLLPGSITPDGQGGVFATWNDMIAYASSAYMVSHVSASGQSDFRLSALDNMTISGSGSIGTVILDDNGTGYFYGSAGIAPSPIVAFDTSSGQQIWTVQAGISVEQMFAQDGGGVVVQGFDSSYNPQVLAIDSSGNVGPAMPMDQILTDSWTGGWFSAGPGGISALNLALALNPASPWPETFGNPSQSLFGTPGCQCLTQTTSTVALMMPTSPMRRRPTLVQAAFKAKARLSEVGMFQSSGLADCPVCDLTPPSCLTLSGSQSTFLLIVGDQGRNNGPGHNWNVGAQFGLAAQQEANDLQSQGHKVVACRAHTVQDFNNQLTGNGLIDGGVIYFGHSGRINMSGTLYSALFVGQDPFTDENLYSGNVSMLSNAQLGSSTTITLNGCDAGSETYHGAKNSIAQLIANQLKRTVYGYQTSTYFSPLDARHETMFTRSIGRSDLPTYMVPVGPAGDKPAPTQFLPH